MYKHALIECSLALTVILSLKFASKKYGDHPILLSSHMKFIGHIED